MDVNCNVIVLYYVKNISYYAVQKEKLYFLMKYSVQGKPFIFDYVILLFKQHSYCRVQNFCYKLDQTHWQSNN